MNTQAPALEALALPPDIWEEVILLSDVVSLYTMMSVDKELGAIAREKRSAKEMETAQGRLDAVAIICDCVYIAEKAPSKSEPRSGTLDRFMKTVPSQNDKIHSKIMGESANFKLPDIIAYMERWRSSLDKLAYLVDQLSGPSQPKFKLIPSRDIINKETIGLKQLEAGLALLKSRSQPDDKLRKEGMKCLADTVIGLRECMAKMETELAKFVSWRRDGPSPDGPWHKLKLEVSKREQTEQAIMQQLQDRLQSFEQRIEPAVDTNANIDPNIAGLIQNGLEQ